MILLKGKQKNNQQNHVGARLSAVHNAIK